MYISCLVYLTKIANETVNVLWISWSVIYELLTPRFLMEKHYSPVHPLLKIACAHPPIFLMAFI